MDRKAIETLSVNAVRDSVVVSDFLDQFIADNDKEPTWDGFVYIYSDKSKKKEKLKGRLPVQIKGTENDDFSKEGAIGSSMKVMVRATIVRSPDTFHVDSMPFFTKSSWSKG